MSDAVVRSESVPTNNLAARWRIAGLGAALIALGLTRGWADGAALVRDLTYQGRLIPVFPSSSPWSDYGGAAFAAWPIVVGLVLVVRRPPTWLKAAAITALALAVERAAMLAAGAVFDSGWSTLYRGEFDRSQGQLLPRGIRLAARVGTVLAWFVLGFAAIREAARSRRPLGDGVKRRSRRVRFPNAASTLFAITLLGMAGWATYIHGLERLPWARAYVLSGDRPRNRPPTLDGPMRRQLRDAEKYLAEGRDLAAAGQLAEARRAFIRGVNRLEAMMDEHPKDMRIRNRFAFASNNLAWFLATCEDPSLRDAEVAVAVARKSLAAKPDDGNTLNTLAIAHFRAGQFDESSKAFTESMALREGGDSFDWFFLAQIEAIRNHPVEARTLYDKATAWAVEHPQREAELRRFQIESAQRLGLPKPEFPEPTGMKISR